MWGLEELSASTEVIEWVEIVWGCGCPTACKKDTLGRVKGREMFLVVQVSMRSKA